MHHKGHCVPIHSQHFQVSSEWRDRKHTGGKLGIYINHSSIWALAFNYSCFFIWVAFNVGTVDLCVVGLEPVHFNCALSIKVSNPYSEDSFRVKHFFIEQIYSNNFHGSIYGQNLISLCFNFMA